VIKKKRLVTFLLGIFVLAGVVTAQANPSKGTPPNCGPDMMVPQLSDDLGLDSVKISNYISQGDNPHDLVHAALSSKISGKSLVDVLSMKTLANTWEDVDLSLGITKEQLHALHNDILATKMARNLSISKKEVLDLINSGYIPPDITVAAMLAKDTQKPINDILSMKKINNKWSDVLETLGVDKENFMQDMQKKHVMPGPEMHGPGIPPFMGPAVMFEGPGGL
jgi:hypothetical protein